MHALPIWFTDLGGNSGGIEGHSLTVHEYERFCLIRGHGENMHNFPVAVVDNWYQSISMIGRLMPDDNTLPLEQAVLLAIQTRRITDALMSIEDLAKLAGVSRQHLNNLANRKLQELEKQKTDPDGSALDPASLAGAGSPFEHTQGRSA